MIFSDFFGYDSLVTNFNYLKKNQHSDTAGYDSLFIFLGK